MGTIKFAPAEQADFLEAGDQYQLQEAGSDATDRSIRSIFGGEDELELFEVRKGPNISNEPHAHVEDEIVYVLEGSLVIGNRTFEAGSAILIPAWTLYSFRSGPNGVRFANFRPRASEPRLIPKDEFVRTMAERRAAAND